MKPKAGLDKFLCRVATAARNFVVVPSSFESIFLQSVYFCFLKIPAQQ
jgi:hypothetical protein